MVNSTSVAGWLESAPKTLIVGNFTKIESKSVDQFSNGLRIYCIEQNIRGTKRSRISQFYLEPRMFCP